MHIIIFSRLASKRFKNKAKTILVNNKTLTEHIIDQARKLLPKENNISYNKEKKKMITYAISQRKKNINFFRGSENNVLRGQLIVVSNIILNIF